MKKLLVIVFFIACCAFSFSVAAGSWVASERTYSHFEERIQPYSIYYENVCHGGVPGISGGYIYGQGGQEYGSPCQDDAITGWSSNFSVTGGQCRPNPEAVGGGWSCIDRNHGINGVRYNGALPSSCNVIGQYAVDSTREVQLIYFGNGNMPDDYYEQITVFAQEYRCV